MKLSTPPLRSLRLGGECFQRLIHRRDAEVAEIAQGKPKLEHPLAASEVEAANCLRYSLGHAVPAEGSHNGSAAVLKTAGRKAMQVRVLSPPPFLFNNLPLHINHDPSVPVATWRDFGAIPVATGLGRNGKGCLFRESTAVRRFSGIA